MGGQVKRPDIKQGWGEWAGEGVDNSKHELRQARAEDAR